MTNSPATMGNSLAAALAYARRGWSVFPCQPRSKIPLTPNGVKDATKDPATLTAWWQKWPSANLALACGAPSGVVCIDVDHKDGKVPGIESWRDLLQKHGQGIADTVCQETPTGGLHFLYGMNGEPIPNDVRNLGPGIEVRSTGYYIVLAPSIHPNGRRYGWALGASPDEAPLLPFPHALLSQMNATPKATPIPDTILETGRNNTLASLAGSMRRRGASEAAIYAALSEENQTRCKPPLIDDEVRAIAHSVSRYAPKPDANLPAVLDMTPRPESEPEGEPRRTDWGNAALFATKFGPVTRFDYRRQRWLLWRTHRWKPDVDSEVVRLAADIARERLRLAADVDDKDERKAAISWAIHSEDHGHLLSMVDFAKSHHPIAMDGSRMDHDPWLLGCENGTLDLRTGELRDGLQDDHITMGTLIPYDAQASCPRWEQFLREIFQGNADMIAFIRRAVGYSICADTREQCLFLCWGGGANGKSTFLNTVRAILGDYATNTPFSTFELESRSSIPNDIAALVNLRLVTASETAEAKRLNEARVKAITGGDPISCRFMRGEYFSYTPTYKVWLAMNYKPVVTGSDLGIWRRIRLIPFLASFAEHPDKTLGETLLSELPGILAWAVVGCLEWQYRGLEAPAIVTDATETYRLESDLVGQFISECTIALRSGTVRANALYRAYEDWCKGNGEKPMTGTAFGRRLAERAIEKTRSPLGMVYHGIALTETTQGIDGNDELPI